MDKEKIKVLLIEDDPSDLYLIKKMLAEERDDSFVLEHTDNLSEGLVRLNKTDFDVFLLDLGLPDSWGLETFITIHAQARQAPIVVLSGLDDKSLTINAARKLGIPEIARMTDLPPLEPPLSLDKVLQYYIERRKPSPEEVKKMKASWKEFCDIVPARTVREISSDMIHDYRDIIWAEYEKNGWANSWLKARFSRVKTLFNHYFKHGRSNKKDLKNVIDFCKCLSVPSSVEEDARPIEKEHVHQLLEHCDIKWRAIILLAINCGYYAKDIHDLKRSMIRDRNGLDHIVFPREKNKHKRVNVLWPETKTALDEYLSRKKHNSDYVFNSQLGTPFNPHDVQRCFGRLRKKAGIPDSVKFNNFRDGSASALLPASSPAEDCHCVIVLCYTKDTRSATVTKKPEKIKNISCSADSDPLNFPENS